MAWITTSGRYLSYFFTTKRGIVITLIGALFNALIIFILMVIAVNASPPLSPTEMNDLRDKAIGSANTINLLWFLALGFEGAYLFNNGLFQRFLLNGFNQWQWGHTLLCSVGIIALLLSFLQTLIINWVGYTMFDTQALSWGTGFRLALKMLYYGGFTLLLVALFPSYLIPIGILGWLFIENLLTSSVVVNKIGEMPNYLPFQVFSRWVEQGQFLNQETAFVIGYFTLFLVLFYTILNRKVYG